MQYSNQYEDQYSFRQPIRDITPSEVNLYIIQQDGKFFPEIGRVYSYSEDYNRQSMPEVADKVISNIAYFISAITYSKKIESFNNLQNILKEKMDIGGYISLEEYYMLVAMSDIIEKDRNIIEPKKDTSTPAKIVRTNPRMEL